MSYQNTKNYNLGNCSDATFKFIKNTTKKKKNHA